MIKLILVVAFLGVASAQFQRAPAPRPGPPPAPRPGPSARTGEDPRRQVERDAVITSYRSESDSPGVFTYEWEASDGSSASAKGILKPPASPTGEPIQEVQGFYTYAGDDGPVRVDYLANENGFQAQSDAIPKPHPIPELIRRSLDEIFAGIEQEGKLSKQELDEIKARYNY